MGFPCLPEHPGLPEGRDTCNSGFGDMDCLAENCQAPCTEASISHTRDTRCRNYKLRSGRARSFGGWAGIKEVKPLPYPRCWVLTCRLMPTMERRTLPQLGHRHLYITFTEFWQRDSLCHPVTSGSVPSTGRRSTQATLLVLGPHPPTPTAAVPFFCVERVHQGERGQSRSRSHHPPGGSSGPHWSTWGCRRGGEAKGWRCRCLRSSARWWCCSRCPRHRHSPSRDRTLPVRLQGGDTCCHHQLGANQPPPRGQRPALRLDNPQQQFASIYFFKNLVR